MAIKEGRPSLKSETSNADHWKGQGARVRGKSLMAIFRSLGVGTLVALILFLNCQMAEGFLPSNSGGNLPPLREYQNLTDEGRRKLRQTEFGRYLAYAGVDLSGERLR
jgi:hypothetical protein